MVDKPSVWKLHCIALHCTALMASLSCILGTMNTDALLCPICQCKLLQANTAQLVEQQVCTPQFCRVSQASL